MKVRDENNKTRLAAHGDAASEIASELGIGEAIVRHHLQAIYRRLGVERRSELAELIAASAAGR